MKWLFAILVALNIIVFGSMMAGKMIRQNQADNGNDAPQQPVVAPPPVIPSTPVVSVASEPADAVAPATASGQPRQKTRAEINAEAQAKARAQAQAQARNEAKDKEPAAAVGKPQANCTASAVLPEDDYHRIKGLLRWPHAANRFVEQNNRKATAKTGRTRFMVVVGGGSEARAQLKEKGFDSSMSNGQVSLGVFNRRSDAESLLARAQGSGFAASIVQLGGGEGGEGESQALSVAKIRVTFSNVDDQSAAEISKIIGRYGSLQRAKCKRS